jgi:hypothetical protein
MQLRTITLDDTAAIDLIAQRMRATLVEVEGEEAGGGMYSMDWLRDRVRWHLDGRAAEVVVAEDPAGAIVGHTIYRIEADADDAPFGLVSTTYVVPQARRRRVAVPRTWPAPVLHLDLVDERAADRALRAQRLHASGARPQRADAHAHGPPRQATRCTVKKLAG